MGKDAIDIEGLNKFISRTKLLLFGFTPTLENGVSVKVAVEATVTATDEWGEAYFKHRFCYLVGVLSSRSAKQMPFRIRHAVPTTMWIADKGSPHPLSSCLLPDEVRADLKQTAADVSAYTYLQGVSEGCETSNKNTMARLEECLPTALYAAVKSHLKFDEDEALAPAYKLLCELIARENYDKLNLKGNLIALFREGHNVILDESEPCKEMQRERKELSAQLLKIEADEFAFTDDTVLSDGTPFSPDDARKILDEHKANKVDRIKARKCLQRERLPIPRELDRMELVNEAGESKTVRLLDHPDFVHKWFKDGFESEALKDLRNFWAVMNPEKQQQADTANVNSLFKNAAHKTDSALRFVLAADVRVDGVKTKLLADSPFPRCLQSDRCWCLLHI